MIKCYADVHHQYINIPKCAGTSILSAMYKLEGTPAEIHDQAPPTRPWRPDGPPTFAVIRTPFARFRSTWMNKVYMPHREDTALIKMGARKGMRLAEFLMFVLQKPELQMYESHIRSQSKYLPDDLSKVTLIRHEDLGVDWYTHGLEALYGALPRLNRSSQISGDIHQVVLDGALSNAQRKAVDLMYENDMKIWEGAQK